MFELIARKRTSFEKDAWEQVRELMPRKQATRGIQYEALEYLFEHLYEKISEEQMYEHFLEVKGHLQQKGDPVKSAINLAIKELQRLSEPTFELIKIQEASLVGKTRRYVQLNYTGFDSVIDYPDFESYLADILSGKDLPILRSVYNCLPDTTPTIFPGIHSELLKKIRAFALVSSLDQVDRNNRQTEYFLIPESQSNQCFVLLYENESSSLPFLGFITDMPSVKTVSESRFLVYRGEEKLARLEFYHQLWLTQQIVALTLEEAEAVRESALQIHQKVPESDVTAIEMGMIAAKARQKWQVHIRAN